jgi:hypothetical protein
MLVAAAAAALLVGAGSRAAAQGPLAEARALYAAAAYEEALSALARLDPAAKSGGEANQYRAFCLIALGRTADAERAIESVVSADPLFLPRSADVSPRILAMFSDVRRRILPGLARRAYLDGRQAFQAKDFATATRQFDQALRVIDQAGKTGGAGMDDLQILVSGFVDLARAETDRSSRAAGPPPAPIPAPPAPVAPKAPTPDESFTGPVALNQDLPAWNPPTPQMGSREYAGAVKVLIGADGRVQQASLVKSVNPVYDPLVLQAARRWTYRPATRLGEPTPSEKVVTIRLTPR